MNNKETTFVYILLIVSLLVSCTESVTNTEKVDRFPDIYPDYIGVTIPAGIAPMDFNVEEMGCDNNCIDFGFNGKEMDFLEAIDALKTLKEYITKGDR